MSDTPIQDSKEETTRLKAKIAELEDTLKLCKIASRAKEGKIVELEAQLKTARFLINTKINTMNSVACELDKEGYYLDERDMHERVFDTDFLNNQIKLLRGKVPEQYNYDTPAKPATDHEEVAPDPDIQKQREKKSNA